MTERRARITRSPISAWLRLLATVAAGSALLAEAGLADASTPVAFGGYKEPAPEVVRLLTAPRPAEPLLHGASGRVALLQREPVLPLDRLARPWLGLAGFRFDPETRISGVEPLVSQVQIISTSAPGQALALWRPADGARLDDVRFAPDGRTLSAVSIGEGPARLALFDIETGTERRLDAPIQAAWGAPCAWVDDHGLLCRMLPEHPGPLPTLRVEPDVLEHEGGAVPLRTYSNLLDDAHEEELFEHYFTCELARIGVDGSVKRLPESRGLLSHVVPSPDGMLAVVTRIQQPYSHMVPARRFPSVVEIWSLAEGIRVYASSPQGIGVAEDEVGNDPRRFSWRPGQPTTLGWIEREAPADGDGRTSRWVALEAPFATAVPREVTRSERPIEHFAWTTEGTPLFTTRSDDGAGLEVYVVRPDGTQAFWTSITENRYLDPGRALRVDGDQGPILERDGRVFLVGDGLGPQGPQPFLESLHLETLETERLYTSGPDVYESVVGVLDPTVPAFVSSRETETDAPRLFVISGAERTALHAAANPYPELAATERRRVEYARTDGVTLRGTLYLPPGWTKGKPLPTLIWIYPREFSEEAYAEQQDVRLFRFHHVRGASPLAAALRGYAVLVNPTMPIIGEGTSVNDTYLEQLVESAGAAVDHLVEIGVTDPERVAIGGHSYGAFSAANLLVHTRRFATGLVLSGAYNRTLTPFGFQHEKRSLWKATRFYREVSPFFFVDQLRNPVLVVHGAADPNPGTPPLQARSFFHALVGTGANARYVEMPFEEHHLRARESVLHVSAEMLDWLDRTIGSEASGE
jgi:dipeptidyl aminopeptidase/acylaminoacyl peptidase